MAEALRRNSNANERWTIRDDYDWNAPRGVRGFVDEALHFHSSPVSRGENDWSMTDWSVGETKVVFSGLDVH